MFLLDEVLLLQLLPLHNVVLLDPPLQRDQLVFGVCVVELRLTDQLLKAISQTVLLLVDLFDLLAGN